MVSHSWLYNVMRADAVIGGDKTMLEDPKDKLYWTQTANVYGDDGDVEDDDGLVRCDVTDTECAHRC